MHRARVFTGVLASVWVALFLVACQEQSTAPTDVSSGGLTPAKASAIEAELSNYLDTVNVQLEADGVSYRAAKAEAITAASSGEAGITVIAKNVGNKQLGQDYVPNDARRPWSSSGGNAITYAIDTTGDADAPGPATAAQTDAAIVRGHNSWEALTCSVPGQNRNPDFGIDIGVFADIVSGGAVGSPFIFADVQHAGWLDLNFAGGVLGVTITFVFCGVTCATLTDIDNNGKLDTAFAEIYYDPSWTWHDDGTSNIDVETVALHEIGHGLSQGHFGSVFFKNDGTLVRRPLASMNAIYTMPLVVLQGNDNGGHCSNWAEWPNN